MCGQTTNSVGFVVKLLTCGGLAIGHGNGTTPENLTPDGATSRFVLANCAGDTCDLAASVEENASPLTCTSTGCPFGPPLPIPNGGLSTCVLNEIAEPVAGAVDLGTGEVTSLDLKLVTDVFLTGNAMQPCPLCSATGTPAAPGTGTCNAGPSAGLPCTSTNSRGLSHDCPPGGPGASNVGQINVDLSPLATVALEANADANFKFCPGQPDNGAFRNGLSVRKIVISGAPAGPISATPAPLRLASIFCIPATGNGLVDFGAGLPGPGATTLVGDAVFVPAP